MYMAVSSRLQNMQRGGGSYFILDEMVEWYLNGAITRETEPRKISNLYGVNVFNFF